MAPSRALSSAAVVAVAPPVVMFDSGHKTAEFLLARATSTTTAPFSFISTTSNLIVRSSSAYRAASSTSAFTSTSTTATASQLAALTSTTLGTFLSGASSTTLVLASAANAGLERSNLQINAIDNTDPATAMGNAIAFAHTTALALVLCTLFAVAIGCSIALLLCRRSRRLHRTLQRPPIPPKGPIVDDVTVAQSIATETEKPAVSVVSQSKPRDMEPDAAMELGFGMMSEAARESSFVLPELTMLAFNTEPTHEVGSDTSTGYGTGQVGKGPLTEHQLH